MGIVAAGENLGMAGPSPRIHLDEMALVGGDAVAVQPPGFRASHAEGGNDGVTGDGLFVPAVGESHPRHVPLAEECHGRTVEEETDTLLAGRRHLPDRGPEVFFAPAIGHGDRCGTVTYGTAGTVHRRVAAAENQDVAVAMVAGCLLSLDNLCVDRRQVDEAVDDSVQVFSGDRGNGRGLRARRDEYRVVRIDQSVERVVVDGPSQDELDTGLLEEAPPGRHHGLVHPERRRAVGEQSPGLGRPVENGDGEAGPGELVGAGQSGRAGPDDGRAFAVGRRTRPFGPPAAAHGFLGDEAFQRADGDGAAVGGARAGTLAQAVAGTQATAHLGKVVGGCGDGGGVLDLAGGQGGHPLGDAVPQRARVDAAGDAAIDAARSLPPGGFEVEGFPPLGPVRRPFRGRPEGRLGGRQQRPGGAVPFHQV